MRRCSAARADDDAFNVEIFRSGIEAVPTATRKAVDEIDVTELLPRVTVPTLVLHCRDEMMQPFEGGRRMAAMIPGARFVALEGPNHRILEHDPAWPRFLHEVQSFLAGNG